MNNLYNSIKYAAAKPKNLNKLNFFENLRFKGMQVGEHVGKHKKPYGALAGTGLAGGGYALGRKQSANKEASAKDWIKSQTTKGKDYLNSLRLTGKGSSKPGPGKNRFYNDLVGKKGYQTSDAQSAVNKRRAITGAIGAGGIGVGAGAYALKKRNNNSEKEASYYEIGHALLEKSANPPSNIFQRGLRNIKEKANLFRSVKSGKNNVYNTFSGDGAEHGKQVLRKARQKFGKDVAIGAAGVGVVGGSGYAMGKRKTRQEEN